MKKILCIVGTRPEAIKMAPVIKLLDKHPEFQPITIATAQHRELLDQVIDLFGIHVDRDLDLMTENQSLSGLTSRLIEKLDSAVNDFLPDVILAQGDTTSVLAAALVSFYHRLPFGHVEAGLRTHDLSNPFPEEGNRTLAGKLASFHFAPTESAKENLIREQTPQENIYVTGNTVIDALYETAEKGLPLEVDLDNRKKKILVTVHRRESFGEPFKAICSALARIAESEPDFELVYPLHPNPNIRGFAKKYLEGYEGIRLLEPLDYASFIMLMKQSYLILTDSGGIQEEAPALGIPALVLRNETERPEALEAGVVKLIGTSEDAIVEETRLLLSDSGKYSEMAKGVSPYGDGKAAARIVDILGKSL